MISPSSLRAQTQDARRDDRKTKDKEKPWQPVVVDAAVLKFGADFEEAASLDLKAWVWDYVKKSLRDKQIVPKEVIGAVDTRYASASDLARDAGIYLVYYLASKDDDENQRMLSYRIRDIDRETYYITRDLKVMAEDEQNRMSALRNPITLEQRTRREEREQQLNAKLRELGDERQIKSTQIAFSRKKVDIYLKLMNYAYERMKGTDPAVLHELK